MMNHHLLPAYCFVLQSLTCTTQLAVSVNGFHLPSSTNIPQQPLHHAQPRIHHGTIRRTITNTNSRSSIAALSEGGDDNEILATDRAPCFDNGFCVSFPDDDDVENNGTAEQSADAASSNGKTIDSKSRRTSAVDSTSSSPSFAGEAIQRLGSMTGPTVWSEFGRLSQEYDLANLGQGFPDWLPPDFAVESLVSATIDSTKSPHQYTRTAGHPNLVRQLARRYSEHLGEEVDAMNEVAVTVGASQALYLSLQTLVQPGDEVVLFEPFFDLYVNQIKLAGGTPVFVPLTFVPYNQNDDGEEQDDVVTGGTWILEPEKLKEKISSKTRAIILNSPHNPTGKIFTLPEMEMIAENVVNAGPQCVVISDEVYKYIIHSPPKNDEKAEKMTESSPGHVHFASLPNMWDRTITVSSAGKTFSATGWQVGWCVGPSHLIAPIHQILPYVQFCASTVIQEALARSLPRADEPYEGYESYYQYLNEKYRRKRDLLAEALNDAGFAIPDYDVTPGGGFFIFARITPELKRALPKERLELPFCSNPAAPGGTARLDWALCQWMAEEKGVLCIPSSPFFSRERALEGASDEFIRVAFCKTDETIEQAALALKGLRSAGKDDADNAADSIEKEMAVAAAGGV
eukprot:CAMPEP_0172303246 /NCGR_PEP_ID=MMETSP1058-20130122/4805_1 /TAXON_ID=83371 /ORGANISM="Detonula confervacea, Strain CCMP 353" /LENGTH=628 /DNA_ID=CAMNT_0013013987 /DNA_START=128 /DNA_END=2014 /DNA_ORIENTATION=+